MFKELGAKKEKQQRGRGFLKWEPKEGSLGSSCQKSRLPNSPQMWVETGASLCLLICFNALINSRAQTAALAQPRWRKEGQREALQPQLTAAFPCLHFIRPSNPRPMTHTCLMSCPRRAMSDLTPLHHWLKSVLPKLLLWACWQAQALLVLFSSQCWFSPVVWNSLVYVFEHCIYWRLHSLITHWALWSSGGSKTN